MANVTNAPAQVPQPNAAEGKPKKKKKDKAVREKRKATPLRAALMTCLFFLFLLSAVAALIYFDVLDLRQIAVNLLLEGKSPYNEQLSQLGALSDTVAQENAALEAGKAELDTRGVALDKAEKDLASREAAQTARAAELDAREAALEETQASIERTVAMFERMEAASAAGICQEIYDDDDIARILSRMKEANAAAILAAMDSGRAARVTELLME